MFNIFILLGLMTGLTSHATTWKPFAEFEPVKYVVMPAMPYYGGTAQDQIIAHLPAGVEVILYSVNAEDLQVAEELWGVKNPDKTIHYVNITPSAKRSKGISYWAIDNMPYPVWDIAPNGTAFFRLVDTQYKHGFEPDAFMAEVFRTQRTQVPYQFDFGNFITNGYGHCLVINGRTDYLNPDSFYHDDLGCLHLIRLPWLTVTDPLGQPEQWGIGHADERVKFLDHRTVATDAIEYEPILTAEHFRIVRLPRAPRGPLGPFRSYVNARLINGTAFVPVYGVPSDKEAVKAYSDAGFRTVPVDASASSDYGAGAIHCMTAVYPALPPGVELNLYSH